MGAWHHGPYENDSALDWMGLVEKPVHAAIAKALRLKKTPARAHYGYHEAIAAAQLLVDLSRKDRKPNLGYIAFHSGTYGMADDALQLILKDEIWIGTWKTPALVRNMLRTLIKDIRVAKAREKKASERAAARLVRVMPKRKRKAA